MSSYEEFKNDVKKWTLSAVLTVCVMWIFNLVIKLMFKSTLGITHLFNEEKTNTKDIIKQEEQATNIAGSVTVFVLGTLVTWYIFSKIFEY